MVRLLLHPIFQAGEVGRDLPQRLLPPHRAHQTRRPQMPRLRGVRCAGSLTPGQHGDGDGGQQQQPEHRGEPAWLRQELRLRRPVGWAAWHVSPFRRGSRPPPGVVSRAIQTLQPGRRQHGRTDRRHRASWQQRRMARRRYSGRRTCCARRAASAGCRTWRCQRFARSIRTATSCGRCARPVGRRRAAGWACYHTEMDVTEHAGVTMGSWAWRSVRRSPSWWPSSYSCRAAGC